MKNGDVIVLSRIAYGPDGFTCRCGGKDFDLDKKKRMSPDRMMVMRGRWRCIGCGENYLFLSVRPGGGTTF